MKFKVFNKNIFFIKERDYTYCFNKNTLQIIVLNSKDLEVIRKSKKDIEKNLPIEIRDFMLDQTPKKVAVNFIPSFFGFRIALTEKCNLNCKHCFVKNNKNELTEMSENTLKRVLAYSIKQGKKRSIKYHFFGGEPLLKMDLIKKAVSLLENEHTKGRIKKPIFAISTNGTLVDRSIAKFFHKHNFLVGVSLDGLKKDNDKLRIHYDGSGTYKDIINALELLKNNRVNFYLLVTPYKENIKKFYLHLKTILKKYPMIKTVTINTPVDSNLGWILPGKMFSDVVFKSIQLGNKNDVAIESSASSILYSLSNNLARKSPCALFNTEVLASVSPKGDISYCAQDWRSESKEIDKKLGVTPFKIPNIKDKTCYKCPCENLCGGPCYKYKKRIGKIDANRCLFFKEMLKTIIINSEKIEKWKIPEI